MSSMGTVKKPDIIRRMIIINDDYIRKNRRSDGKINLPLGAANTKNNQIILNKFALDKNATLLTDADIQDIKSRLKHVDENDIIAHEFQHIHNSSIGYNYLANSDNIYECMMLAMADELSAMIAGYIHKTKNLDDAVNLAIENMSKPLRQEYIKGQFANHFAHLQKVWGEYKNLYELKYDSKKIKQVTNYYFTINGQNIFQSQELVTKTTKLKFNTFFTEFKNEIKEFINNYIQNKALSNQSNFTHQ